MNQNQKGLMKGLIKTGILFSVVLVAALALFYVLPALADATVTSTVNPASVNTRQNVTLNFTITATGNSSLANISINVTGAGFVGLIAGNIVCPNATDAGQGTPWNASIAGNTQLATCFRNHTTQNLSGTISMAIKGLSANLTGQTSNFTINVTDDIDRTNITTVSVTVLLLEGNATLDISNVRAGAEENYTFTIRNNGTDPIDRINITYNANFEDPAAADIVCPTTNALWNRSVGSDIITCTRADPPNDDPIAAGGSATIKVENWSAPNDARVKTFDVNVRGLKGGNFTVVSSKPSVSVLGNLSITGINRAQTTNNTGTTNLTMITFDINATGEQMNITGINITINGTVTQSDLVRVGLYNSTFEWVTTFNSTGAIDLLLWNNSAPVAGGGNTLRYNFSNLALTVNVSQKLIVVLNLSSTAVGGGTFNASIETASDVITTGGHSGQSISETLASQRSSTTMIIGTLSVTGTSQVAATNQIGTTNITVITFNLSAAGEQMNISEIIITRNGTNIADADIVEVKLFNTTDPAATTVNATQTPLATNTSAPSANGRYNFSGLTFRVPTGATGQILLVSFNLSTGATGGRTFNASIEGAADIATNASTSGAAVVETLASQRSSTSTIAGNLSIGGASRVAATTRIGSTNVTIISFNFSATGEAMNISGINITLNGTRIATADIARVGLYNSSAAAAGVLDGSGVNYDLIQWNISAPVAGGGNTLRFNFSNIGFNITAGTPNVLLVVVNLSSGATGGRTFNASIEGAADINTTGGVSAQSIAEFVNNGRSSSSTIFGNLTVSGTSRVASQTRLGSTNVTIISFNFSAYGEQMNVTGINITINGTNIGTEDIARVALYNSTKENAQTFNETGNIDLIQWNTSAPVAGGGNTLRYNFSNIGFNVSSSQILLVVVNISSTADAGRTLNASIEGAADVVTVGNASGVAITEDFTGQRSATSTLVGMKITGTSRVASTTQIGSKNVTIISFTFNATGEDMNVTGINITINGSAVVTSDIVRVALYNSTRADAGVFNGTSAYDLIQWNISAPVAGAGNTLRYNFSNIGNFNITAGTINTLVVVVNISDSAIAGRTFNASIEGAADVNTTGRSSSLSITETFTSQRSSSSTIIGNISVTGTNIAPSAVDVGQIGAGILALTLNATGEAINVTSINVTFNGTSRTDVLAVRLFNDSGGATAGTYERGGDLPVAGASGAFTGATVILTPTSPIQVPLNSLYYTYVVFDVNTTATAGADRLGASIQAAANVVATGNESYATLTPQIITGDPGAVNVDIRNLTATATVITATTAVARTGAGTVNNFTFTINNTATGSLKDSIDEIRILYGGTGFTLAGNATCPTISSIAWNRSVLSASTIVCNVTDSGGRLAADTNTTISVQNFTAGQTAGIPQMNISVRGASGGVFNITSSVPTITVYGNLSFNGTNRVNSTIAINTTQLNGTGVTLISYNVTAGGEAINVSEIIVEINGTSIASADIQSVSLFNSTNPSTTIANGSQTLIRTNASVTSTPTSLRYNLSGLNLSVPTGTTGQILLVTVNVSAFATGGRTLNATIKSDADIVSVGSLTAIAISENQTNMNSSTTTILGNLTIIGTSRVAATTQIDAKNVTIISFNFSATGEQMNITGINITINGSGLTNAHITRVALYNSSAAAAGLLDGSGVNYDLIQWNISAPVAGGGNTLRYNFSNIGFNVSSGGTNVLLVVVNISGSAAGGVAFNASIEGAADVITTGGGSNTAIVEHFTSQRSSSSTIIGNLSVTGTNRVASFTRLGSTNVTIISFNFSAAGEQMNITGINITINGTNIGTEDIARVALYNSTKENAQTFNETGNIDLIAWNISAPVAGAGNTLRYNFSNIVFNIPSSQIVMVVVNISSSAVGNRTFNASIEGAADVITTGNTSYQAITETFVTQRSSTSTLLSLDVTGTNRVASTIQVSSTNVTFLSLNFSAAGETVNVTEIKVTLNGTINSSNVVSVTLYNSTNPSTTTYNGSQTVVKFNTSISGAGVYNFTIFNLTVPTGATGQIVLVVANITSSPGGNTMNLSVDGTADIVSVGATSGLDITEVLTTTRSSTTTIFGNLSVTGTSQVASFTRLGSTNVTIISFNFTATGEQMNVSEIIVTRNGTITDSEVIEVKLYNSTNPSTTTYNGSQTPLATNRTPTASGRYNFSINLSVPTGATGQIVLVVFNISSTAVGGRTLNASIEAASDIVTLGNTSYQAIAETLATGRSGTSTLVALDITGASRVASTVQIGTNNVTVISFNFSATGERMNISGINVTFNGTFTARDIARVGLYNSTRADAGIFNGTAAYDLIQWNTSAPVAGGGNTLRYNFSNIGFNVSTGTTNVLLVVVNVSSDAAGGVTFNASIEGAADINTTGGASDLPITETFTSQRSASGTIFGNLTATGTSQVASFTRLGATNVTVISFNFTATGEQMNVSEIIVTRNGTITDSEVIEVKLYNSTNPSTTTYNGSQTPLATNRTPTASGRYNFSINLSVPTGATGQILLVVLNVSSSAVGGRTFNASIEAASDIVTQSNTSYQAIAEILATGRSGTSTLSSLDVTGTNRVASTIQVSSTNVTFISLNFSAAGETMNVTEIKVTLNGTINSSNVVSVTLYNSTDPGTTTYNGSQTVVKFNTSISGAGVYNFSIFNLTVPTGATGQIVLVVANISSSPGGNTMNLSVDGTADIVSVGATSGLDVTETLTTTRSSTTTIFGNLTVSGTSQVASFTRLGSNNVTVISFNLTATGEQMNVSEIIVTRNGTITDSEVIEVKLYNSTNPSTTTYNGSQTPLATNRTPTASGRYNFSINLSVPTGATGQILLVVLNVSSSATAGRTFNASIEAASDIVTQSNTSYQTIAETLASGRSSTSTLVALDITGTSRVASTVQVGTTNVTVISFNFSATGERMNISGINVTFNGTFTARDIARVGLYNSSASAAGVLDGSGVNYDLIQWNTSAPVAGGGNTLRYNFSNIGFNVSTGTTNVLLVVVNVSSGAAGGVTFNASIEGAADINTTGGASDLPITETFTSQRSASSTIFGNLTATGTSQVASFTRLGSNNVTIISFNFTSTGEQMNVSEIIVTRNGTVTNADIASLSLYSSADPSTTTYNGSQTFLAANLSPTASGRYNFSNINLSVPTGATGRIVLVVFNISSGATAGNTFNASIEAASDIVTQSNTSYQTIAETLASGRSASSTLVTLAVTGGSRVGSTTEIGTGNVTVISFNFSATGERMNITGINITFNGTGLTNADIARVALYNTTLANADVFNGTGTWDLIQWNTSAPVAGGGNTLRYNFSNIGFNVSTGTTNILLVVVNISGSATGGRTFNASIEGADDINTTGGISNLPITETFTSQRSSSSTIFGNLTVSGTSRVASFTRLGSVNVTVITFNFTANGEQMNISEIIVTRNGTVTNADIVQVRLYNTTDPAATALNETQTPLATNLSPTASGRYNFSGLSFRVPTGATGQILLVVFNVSSSATAGRTLNASIEAVSDIATISAVSGQAITETLTSGRSASSTLVSLNVSGSSVAPATVSTGQAGVAMLNLTFTATGETMNITSVNVTITGNGSDTNISEVRLWRDAGTAGVFDSADTYLSGARGTFNSGSVQLNLSVTGYNLSIPIGSTIFFVTYNISAGARNDTTVGVHINPAAVAAVGNSSGLGISVTGNALASSNSTVQAQASITFGTITSTAAWISNKTDVTNSTAVTIPVTNNGNSTANITSVLVTLYNSATAENASTNFTIVRADSLTSIAARTTTTFNFTINSTTAAQLNGRVNVSVRVIYNDSNTLAAASTSPAETNTTALFGLDSILPTTGFTAPTNNQFVKDTRDVNFTLNDTVSGANSSTVVMQINGTTRAATCNASGLNFTCNFTWATNNGSYVDGVYLLNVTVKDNASNTATRVEINVTVDNTAPTFSGDNVTRSLINTTITTLFSVNITERNFNSSNTFVGIRNLTNVTVQSLTTNCALQSGAIFRCNATWNGSIATGGNVPDSNYTFFLNTTDNATTYAEFNSTTVVVYSSDSTSPEINGTGPSTAAKVTTSTPALLVNTTEASTCKFDTSDKSYANMDNTFTGSGLTHNFTLSSQTDGVKAFYVRCRDPIGNIMVVSGVIWFEIDTTGNFNFTQPTSGYFSTGWKTLFIPTQTIIETTGRNASSTGSFNFTSILSSLGTSWSHMYYNINGTSAGWVLATRTDPGGSTLKYVNNTNDKPYFINITAADARFTL